MFHVKQCYFNTIIEVITWQDKKVLAEALAH